MVEDTPVNQKVIVNQLQLLNYQADFANNGREALDKLQEGEYQIVLMDCQMPILDGYQATRAIRQREGTGPRIPIIGLTAHAMKGDREKCLAAGMDDYLSNRVVMLMEDLEAVLARWSPAGRVENFSPEKTMMPVLQGRPLIDRDRLSVLCGGDAEFHQQLLEAFVEDAEMELEVAKEAIASGDTATLTQKAHRLKGSSHYMAVRELPELAAKLEKLAEKNLLEGAVELLAEIESIFHEVKAYVSGDKNAPDVTSPIDSDRLSHICGGDLDLEIEILESFVEDSITDIREAKEAIASRDAGTLVTKAHRLKGASASVGVLLIPELAKRLENQARENRLEGSGELLAEIELILEQVKTFMTPTRLIEYKQEEVDCPPSSDFCYPVSNDGVVDSDRLDEICGGDREFEKLLLQAFIEDAESDIVEAYAAMSANNLEESSSRKD